MFSLSHTTGYAILALSCLRESDDERTLAKDIAENIELPLPYLSKILHRLRRSGMVRAKRGYNGGFVLARPAREINLFQIAEAIEGNDWLPSCMLGLADCSSLGLCPTRDFWRVERDRIRHKLETTTLVEVTQYVQGKCQPEDECGCDCTCATEPSDTVDVNATP